MKVLVGLLGAIKCKGCILSAGMISCFDFSPDDSNMVAAGSYSSIAAVYDVTSGTPAYILSGHKGGITQVRKYCSVMSAMLASFIALLKSSHHL